MQFVAVSGRAKSPGRDPRPGRKPERGADGGPPATGGGLEIDLSAPRQCERLPADLRGHLPARGFVNLPEARAVVRKVEELAGVPGGNGHEHQASLAVVALFPAQAEPQPRRPQGRHRPSLWHEPVGERCQGQ